MRRPVESRLLLALLPALLLALPACPPSAGWKIELQDAKQYWTSISGSGTGNIYAVGSTDTNAALAYRFDGSAWMPVATGTTAYLNSVAVQSSTNIYLTEELTKIWRYRVVAGVGGWAALPASPDAPPKRYYSPLWISSAGRLYTVGDPPPKPAGGVTPNNRFYVFNGSVWTQVAIGSSLYLYGIWGTSDSNVFAVGDSGLIAHYNGVSAEIMPSGTTKYLDGVWAASPTRAYAVGEGGVALRYDGQDWIDMDSGVTSDLYAVWGAGVNDVFAVGAGGVILHYDGRSWRKQDSGVTGDLFGVWGTSGDNVYVAGDNAILRYHAG